MTANNKLAQSKKELTATGKLSSMDSVLLRMLDLAGQITRQEVQPGEARFWKETFRNENPEMLEWAFREYLRRANFFPKPADILKLIEGKRAASAPQPYVHYDREKTAYEQSTLEWEEWRQKMDELLRRMTMPGGKK